MKRVFYKTLGSRLARCEQMFDWPHGVLLLLWLALADAIPALERDIHDVAQREPDDSRIDTERDALISSHSTDRTKNQIAREYTTIFGAEFVGHRESEFTHAHDSTVAVKAQCPGHHDRGID